MSAATTTQFGGFSTSTVFGARGGALVTAERAKQSAIRIVVKCAQKSSSCTTTTTILSMLMLVTNTGIDYTVTVVEHTKT